MNAQEEFDKICYERNECPDCGGDISGEDSFGKQRCYKCGAKFRKVKK